MEVLYLFNIGDKIVYPSQGVGIIDSIEEKEFLGKMKGSKQTVKKKDSK